MKGTTAMVMATTACFLSYNSAKAETADIIVTSTGIENNKPIAEKFAYCAPDGKGKTKKGGNISPQLSWSGAPKETKSFAIVVVDPDVPAKFDDANKEGKIISEAFPRQNFYHWVLVNIPANITNIDEGKGKEKTIGTQLVNDYAGGKKLPEFLGYDGPCPPWNDARLHHYHFTVHALNTEKLEIPETTTGKDIISDIKKHSIAKGELVGTYKNFVK